jgi:hypothetical protein
MTRSLAIGSNEICNLEPGKRYALKVSVAAGSACTLTPSQLDSSGAEVPAATFQAAADSPDPIAWEFDGVADASAGFEFVATRRKLEINSSAAVDVDIECLEIES